MGLRGGSLLTLLVVLLACTAALGGAAPAAPFLLVPLGALALGLAALDAGRRGRTFLFPAMGWVLCAGAGLTALQLVPLPPALLAALSPPAAELREELLVPLGLERWRPLSFDPPSTARALASHLGLLAAFFAAAHLARKPEQRRLLLAGLAAVGVVVALTGLGHLLADASSLFGLHAFEHARPPVLTFFGNPNHLAGFLTPAGLAALAMALTARDRSFSLLWGLGFVLIGAVVLLSLSRGGIAFFLAAVLLLGGLLLRARALRGAGAGSGRSTLPGRLLRAPAFAFVLGAGLAVLSVGAYLAYDQLAAELRTLDSLEKLGQSKVELWPMFARAAMEHPWTGMGRGAFELAFSRHQSEYPGANFTHPENLLLQLAVDLGPLAAALLLLGAGAAIIVALRRRTADALDLAAVAGLGGILLHDLFDFALELSPSALAAALLLGILFRPVERDPKRGTWRVRPQLALGGAVGVLVVGGLCLHLGRHHHLDAERSLAALVEQSVPAPEVLAAALPLIDRHPSDYLLYGLVAQAFSQGPQADAAQTLAFARSTLLLRPLDPDAHLAAARALRRLGRRSQAMLEYRLAQNAGGGAKVMDEAVRTSRDADELWAAIPAEPLPLLQAAGRAWSAGRREDARGLLARAREELSDHPDAPRLWSTSARLALQEGEKEEALALALEAARRDPSSAEVAATVADVLARSGRRKEAISSLEAALGQRLGDLELSLALARQLTADGQGPRARELLERASPFATTARDRSRLLQAEAGVYRAEKRFARALEAYLTASRLSPQSHGLRYEVARMYEQLGRPGEALRALSEGARLEGKVRPEIQQWKERLEQREKELNLLRLGHQALGE